MWSKNAGGLKMKSYRLFTACKGVIWRKPAAEFGLRGKTGLQLCREWQAVVMFTKSRDAHRCLLVSHEYLHTCCSAFTAHPPGFALPSYVVLCTRPIHIQQSALPNSSHEYKRSKDFLMVNNTNLPLSFLSYSKQIDSGHHSWFSSAKYWRRNVVDYCKYQQPLNAIHIFCWFIKQADELFGRNFELSNS